MTKVFIPVGMALAPAFAWKDPIAQQLYSATYPKSVQPSYQNNNPGRNQTPVNYNTYTNPKTGYGNIQGSNGVNYSTYTNPRTGFGNVQGNGVNYNTYKNPATGYGNIQGY